MSIDAKKCPDCLGFGWVGEPVAPLTCDGCGGSGLLVVPCAHDYKETYYGYTCAKCGDFIPFGCEPWVDWEDEELEDLNYED